MIHRSCPSHSSTNWLHRPSPPWTKRLHRPYPSTLQSVLARITAPPQAVRHLQLTPRTAHPPSRPPPSTAVTTPPHTMRQSRAKPARTRSLPHRSPSHPPPMTKSTSITHSTTTTSQCVDVCSSIELRPFLWRDLSCLVSSWQQRRPRQAPCHARRSRPYMTCSSSCALYVLTLEPRAYRKRPMPCRCTAPHDSASIR